MMLNNSFITAYIKLAECDRYNSTISLDGVACHVVTCILYLIEARHTFLSYVRVTVNAQQLTCPIRAHLII